MNLHIIPANVSDYLIIQNMARFYVYDMARTCGLSSPDWAMPDNGLYESFDCRNYFEDKDRKGFLVKVNAELAGFVLLNKVGTSEKLDWNMGEFFIISRFQRQSIGSKMAKEIWDMHPGYWEVSVIPENAPAISFWKNAITEYTNDNFIEMIKEVSYSADIKENRIIFNFVA